MNCQEFCDRISVDPYCQNAAFLLHKQQCEACAARALEAEKFEKLLVTALNPTPPADLTQRILESTVSKPEQSVMQRWRPLLVAASVFLVIGLLAVGIVPRLTSPPALQQSMVISYLDGERPALRAEEDDAVDRAELDRMLQVVGARLKTQADLGQVTACNLVQIDQREAAHIVLKGNHGPVDVVLLPGQPIADRVTFNGPDFQGVILPMVKGNIAISGLPAELIAPIEKRILASIIWS